MTMIHQSRLQMTTMNSQPVGRIIRIGAWGILSAMSGIGRHYVADNILSCDQFRHQMCHSIRQSSVTNQLGSRNTLEASTTFAFQEVDQFSQGLVPFIHTGRADIQYLALVPSQCSCSEPHV